MKIIVSVLLSSLIPISAWLLLTVIGHSADISGLNEFKTNCKDVHTEIKESLAELRHGQTEILKVLIENN